MTAQRKTCGFPSRSTPNSPDLGTCLELFQDYRSCPRVTLSDIQIDHIGVRSFLFLTATFVSKKCSLKLCSFLPINTLQRFLLTKAVPQKLSLD